MGDFSFCDFLDLTIALGTVTYIFRNVGSAFDTYFVMTRGDGSRNIPVMEMTKWLNTKYHYIVLELSSNQTFQPSLEWLENDDALAGQLGFQACSTRSHYQLATLQGQNRGFLVGKPTAAWKSTSVFWNGSLHSAAGYR